MSNSKHAYVISGAGSGIGQTIALRLGQENVQIFGLGRDSKKLEQTARLCGETFSFASVDLANADLTANAIARIRAWLQERRLQLRGLVNNAGVVDRVPFAKSNDALWERQFQNNLMSAVRLTRGLFEELKASTPSSVLNISSNLGLRPIPDTSAYSAMKAAMINWSQTLAREWAPLQIRVNCLCPGLVDTPIHSFFGGAEQSPERQFAHSLSPLGRMGRSEDIADAAIFLLSEKSSWTTGSVFAVDGGMNL